MNVRLIQIQKAIASGEWDAIQLLDEYCKESTEDDFIGDILGLLASVDMMSRVSILFECFSRVAVLTGADVALSRLFASGGSIALVHVSALAHSRQWGDQLFDIFCDIFDRESDVENRHRIVTGLIHSVGSQQRARRYLAMIDNVGRHDNAEKQQTLERFIRKAHVHIEEVMKRT